MAPVVFFFFESDLHCIRIFADGLDQKRSNCWLNAEDLISQSVFLSCAPFTHSKKKKK